MKQKILGLMQKINEEIPDDPKFDLLAGGILDSYDMVNAVSKLEEEFDIEMEPNDIVSDNFRSIDSMYRLVQNYLMRG